MMYRSFSTREKSLLLVLAVLLLCMAYYLLIQVPVSTQLTEAAMDKADAQTELLIAQAKSAQMQAMRDELAEMAAQGAPAAAAVPAYDNLRGVMNLLNTTLAGAGEYNVTFSAIDASQQFVRRTVSMTFTSTDYSTAKNIVLSLLHGPYRCQASNFQLTAGEGGVTVGLTLTFFEAQADLPEPPTGEEAGQDAA
ncbi:MAG: type II secretion system protein GspM [Eubacteriales bacterium]|nr:type II secretion system protein GspM [Eubacteriales bacterium]